MTPDQISQIESDYDSDKTPSDLSGLESIGSMSPIILSSRKRDFTLESEESSDVWVELGDDGEWRPLNIEQ